MQNQINIDWLFPHLSISLSGLTQLSPIQTKVRANKVGLKGIDSSVEIESCLRCFDD